MKILLTGGGTGGHFYPLIAVAEALRNIAHNEKLITPQVYFMSDSPYDEKALFDNDIEFVKVPAGKLRRYVSLQNVTDMFKTAWGTVSGLFKVFGIYPDVVFSKGGYASFPAVLASRILRIPLLVHESDSVAGRANKWAGKFAKRIAISFPSAAKDFPASRTALTGTPVRSTIVTPASDGHTLLGLDPAIPTILVLGGSLGAELINNAVLEILPELVADFQVIHQTGVANLKTVNGIAAVSLRGNPNAKRYHAFDFLHDDALRIAAGCADLVLSRAGASALSELALWGKPSVVIPITDTNGDHQRQNAALYEQSGACIVIQEANLRPHILLSEIRRLLADTALRARMSEAAREFSKPAAAETVARALIDIALTHEQ